MTADQILLCNLQLRCHIGVPDAERSTEQLLHADVVIHSRVSFEAMQDDLACTIDYAAVATRLEQIAAARPRRLIETLAADLAACVLTEFSAAAVEITLRKRILPQTDHVAVRLFRHAGTNT
ncbi:MAG: dihydroneopterin aldolase [Verrucomicrobiaceae bacterium]|nr:dihydroneopterin aldolase [Verrucomicrobiaceae bacterium]